jgi:hypothetical protein
MNESSPFAVAGFALIIACVAEHLIKHPNYYKGTTKEKVWLGVCRVAIAVLGLVVVFSLPDAFNRSSYDPNEPDYSDYR